MGILRLASYFYVLATAPGLEGTEVNTKLQGAMSEVAKLYSEMQETNNEEAIRSYFKDAVDVMKTSIEDMKGSGVVSGPNPEYNAVIKYFERLFHDMKSIMAPIEMRGKITKDYGNIEDILHILNPEQARKLQGILVMNENMHRYANEWNVVWELFEEIKSDMQELLAELAGRKLDDEQARQLGSQEFSSSYRIVKDLLKRIYKDSRDLWIQNESYAEHREEEIAKSREYQKSEDAKRLAEQRELMSAKEILEERERIKRLKEKRKQELITPGIIALKEKEEAEKAAKIEEEKRIAEERAKKKLTMSPGALKRLKQREKKKLS